MMKTAACYVRVSTDAQTTDNQRGEVDALARARGFEPRWYEETGSAAKQRPVFKSMMADARAGRVHAVVVWALDRFGRNLAGTVADVTELERLHVRVMSVRESWLDTDERNPTRGLLLSIFAWVAEYERSRLIERVHAGLNRARKEGK